MRRAFLGTLFALALLHAASSAGRPPLIQRPAPCCDKGGVAESRWVAPFVQYSLTSISGKALPQVRWFSSTGVVESETDTLLSNTDPFGFYFVSGLFGHQTLHGMYGDWHIAGNLESDEEQINVLASPNGRSLVRFLGEKKHGRANAVEIYVTGRKTCTLGPLPRMELKGVRMGDDGSVGALFGPPEGEREALLTDANGALSMRIRAPGASDIQPAPDGRGALIWRTGGGMGYVDSRGNRRDLSPPLKLAPWFAHWLAGSRRVLLGNEKDSIHVLFDLDERRVVWQAKAPAHLDPLYAAPFGEYVFQSGLAAAPTRDEPEGSVRVINALDVRTGKVRSRWRSSPPRRYTWEDMGTLMLRGERLYYVTDDVFTEVSVQDIESGRGDWERVQ